MVRFLVNRPVAVFMAAFAVLLLGIVASFRIPTSLMPDIAIPEITVRLSYPNGTAREIETNITRPLRNRLLQVANLEDIESQTRDGFAVLKLYYEYGTDTNLSFIEANEKVDAALGYLPRDLERPRVIKASATDIPILNLCVSLEGTYTDEGFLQLSEFSETVLKKRIEQLPNIALADMSGQAKPEIQVRPKRGKLNSLGLSNEVLVEAIEQNNFELGNLLVQNGIYQYNFKFSNPLQQIGDIENIFLNISGRLFRLKELAEVSLKSVEERGLVYSNGKRAIVFAIIKQSGARVYDLKEELEKLVISFKKDYPNLDFSVNQDQTKLLKLSINNLKSSLLLGSILAILILFFFLRDLKSPLIIAVSIPVSLVLSILLMYLCGLSINIISLSGLILGVGMMVDNSIIVIDNINQKLETGMPLGEACAKGTNEIITPLISSILTTCSVFFPLVFLSGITGALFYDQALAVSIGLGSSLLVSILLIPAVFKQLKVKNSKVGKWFAREKESNKFETGYEKGLVYFFKRKWMIYALSIGFFLFGVFLFRNMSYSKLPKISQSETVLEIDWNSNINVHKNWNRIQSLLKDITTYENRFSQIGEQNFLLQQEETQDFSQAKIYLKLPSPQKLAKAKNQIDEKIKKAYPNADFQFNPPKTIFEYIFGGEDEKLVARIYSKKNIQAPLEKELPKIRSQFENGIVSEIPLKESIAIEVLHEALLRYKVEHDKLIDELKTAFGEHSIGNLKTAERFIPINLDYGEIGLKNILEGLFVLNENGKTIPVKNLISTKHIQQYKTITANKAGEYLEFGLNPKSDFMEQLESARNSFKNNPRYDVRFAGSKMEFREMENELIMVVLVALFLLYFIMAAQFESLWQPLVVMLEIPINIGAGLLLLWLFGNTINIMAAIGFVVMSGVVVNDSILKLHTINMLKKEGQGLKEAIFLGGRMRLKSIIMTSLTTILAMFPILFIDGLGAELQRPLALVVIGGLFLGTFISLYFIPIIYHDLSRKLQLKKRKNKV